MLPRSRLPPSEQFHDSLRTLCILRHPVLFPSPLYLYTKCRYHATFLTMKFLTFFIFCPFFPLFPSFCEGKRRIPDFPLQKRSFRPWGKSGIFSFRENSCFARFLSLFCFSDIPQPLAPDAVPPGDRDAAESAKRDFQMPHKCVEYQVEGPRCWEFRSFRTCSS